MFIGLLHKNNKKIPDFIKPGFIILLEKFLLNLLKSNEFIKQFYLKNQINY